MFIIISSCLPDLKSSLDTLYLLENPPNPPVSVSASPGDTMVTLVWSDVTGATSYNIYWSTTPGVTTATGTKIAAVTSPYAHTGLVNGTTYYYIVTAVNSVGEGRASGIVNGRPQVAAPGAPTGVSATAGASGSGQITVNWTNVSGANSYNIYWRNSPGVTTGNGTLISGATAPYLHSLLTNGATYYYIVTSVGTGGETASAEVNATLIPAAPAGVAAGPAGSGEVSVSWTAATGATSYRIYWNTTGSTVTFDGNKDCPSSPCLHTGQTNGTNYYYFATAINSAGESPISASDTVIPVGIPTGVVATAGDTEITVNWTAASGALTYNIYFSDTPGVTKATGTLIPAVASPYTHVGRINGTTYYYIVTAKNSLGEEGTASAEVSAVPVLTIGVGPATLTNLGLAFPPATLSNANEPSIGIDTVNNKLLIATENMDNGTRLAIYRCNLDGSSCSNYDVSGMVVPAQGINSGSSPALVVDTASSVPANRKIYIATENSSVGTSRLSLFRCELDMSSCSHVDIQPGVDFIGDEPSIALYIDNVTYSNSRVIIASHYNINGFTDKHPLIFTSCALDLTGCSSSKVSNNFKGYSPEIALDVTNNTILLVTTENNGTTIFDRPLLIRCNLPLAEDCIAAPSNGIDLALAVTPNLGDNTGHYPVIAVDSASAKLLVVSRNVASGERPSLFRCNLDGSGCVHTDLATSAGLIAPVGNLTAGKHPSYTEAWSDIAVDTVNNKLLVVTHDKSNSGKPSLFRCNLDGSSCTKKDLSLGTTAGNESGYAPSIIIDYINKALLVVTEDLSKAIPSPTIFRN